MNWNQIREISQSELAEIGNHSHSHEYLVDESSEVIKKDILGSIKIFKEKLGKNSEFFLTLLENTAYNLKDNQGIRLQICLRTALWCNR